MKFTKLSEGTIISDSFCFGTDSSNSLVSTGNACDMSLNNTQHIFPYPTEHSCPMFTIRFATD